MSVSVVELSERTWPMLERLFGPRGAVEGCWCMFFRLPGPEFKAGQGERNRSALLELVAEGPVGLLAVDGDEPLGWVAVAPRSVYRRLARSPVAKPVDPAEDLTGVWSVTCFFIRRDARRRGIAGQLLAAAVRYATGHGAQVIEAYPVDTSIGRVDSGSLYHGSLEMFLNSGFTVLKRHGPRRALVRKAVG